jgi:metal-dependent amidase/aminoacylase/carboxypeptidase family protein
MREVALATATGAAFLIEGREPGPRILIRAGLDALPITEATGLPFASTVPARVLADGFLGRLEVDAVLGSHITPMLPTGRFGIGSGTLLAGAVGYRVTIRGSGGHGARRRRQGDALSAAAALVERLQSVVPSIQSATGPPPTAPLPTVAVCQLHAGHSLERRRRACGAHRHRPMRRSL